MENRCEEEDLVRPLNDPLSEIGLAGYSRSPKWRNTKGYHASCTQLSDDDESFQEDLPISLGVDGTTCSRTKRTMGP